jgi:hypothetical protein
VIGQERKLERTQRSTIVTVNGVRTSILDLFIPTTQLGKHGYTYTLYIWKAKEEQIEKDIEKTR